MTVGYGDSAFELLFIKNSFPAIQWLPRDEKPFRGEGLKAALISTWGLPLLFFCVFFFSFSFSFWIKFLEIPLAEGASRGREEGKGEGERYDRSPCPSFLG